MSFAGTKNAFPLMIALRYLWSKRSEAFITIISVVSLVGIAIGVLVLCIVMSVMTGFEAELREKIVGADSHVVVRKLSDKITNWREPLETIRAVADVESVSPYTYQQGLIRVEGRSSGVLVRGVEKGSPGYDQLVGYVESPRAVDMLYTENVYSQGGASSDEGEKTNTLPGILIGRELAQNIGVVPGEPVALISPGLSSSPFGLVPKFRRFLVTGTYHSGLVEYEGALVYLDMQVAQTFFRMGDAISGFEVRVKNVDTAPEVGSRIRAALGGIGSGYVIQDWTERNRALWNAIRLEKQVYFLVLLLIIIMASFSVVTTLIMIVLEKRKDIAVLKTLGATSRNIAKIFFMQGSVIGISGTVLGLLLGYSGCLVLSIWGFPIPEEVFQMSTLPIKIEPLNFLAIGVSSLTICCVATLYPAWRASRLQPSEVLRYE